MFFRHNGRRVAILSTVSVAAILLLIEWLLGNGPLLGVHRGSGTFYQVVSYAAMVWIPLAMLLFSLTALGIGLARFSSGMGWEPMRSVRPGHLMAAVRDVIILRYLGGDGDGCNDLNESFSFRRRWLHQTVLFGALSCFVSTTVAAVYDHFLHQVAPYGFWSLPVVTGSLGGIALVIGTGGLFWLKMRRDQRPTEEKRLGMDVVFLAQLFLVALSGLRLLLLRGTAAMGVLLAVHLGLVAGLFLALPYGKFIHAVYRSAALVRFAVEGH